MPVNSWWLSATAASLAAISFSVAALASGAPTPDSTNTGHANPYRWSLQDAITIAERQNPDLKAARAHFEAAKAVVLQAWSGYLPHIDVTANYERTTLPNPSAGLTTQLGVSLPYSSIVTQIRQTLFDFGKTLNGIGGAVALDHASEQDTLAMKNAVDLSVQNAFYGVAATTKLVEVAQEGVVRFTETNRRTQALVRTGARPAFDLTQSNVELSRARLALITATEARDLARVTLLNIMGFSADTSFDVTIPPPSAQVDFDKLDLQELSSKALNNRPEMRSAEFQVEASRLQFHQQTKDYLPTVALEGFYGKYMLNYDTAYSEAWGGGVTLSWNLFDGLDTTGRVGEYSARLDAQGALQEKERERITAEVANSYQDLKKSIANLRVARDSLTFSKENNRLAQKRYDANVATFLELLVSQNTLLDTQGIWIQAQFQYEASLAALKKAVNAPIF